MRAWTTLKWTWSPPKVFFHTCCGCQTHQSATTSRLVLLLVSYWKSSWRLVTERAAAVHCLCTIQYSATDRSSSLAKSGHSSQAETGFVVCSAKPAFQIRGSKQNHTSQDTANAFASTGTCIGKSQSCTSFEWMACVLTDGVLICRHSLTLDDSTNIADFPQFQDRRCSVPYISFVKTRKIRKHSKNQDWKGCKQIDVYFCARSPVFLRTSIMVAPSQVPQLVPSVLMICCVHSQILCVQLS